MSNKLKQLSGTSYYAGEPKVGIAKATGNLSIYDDHIEFEITLGNALGGAFGLAGMLIARRKAVKNGNVTTYLYSDIASVHESKYAGLMPMLTLVMKDGTKHSFAPMNGIAGVADAVVIIRNRLAAL